MLRLPNEEALRNQVTSIIDFDSAVEEKVGKIIQLLKKVYEEGYDNAADDAERFIRG